MEVDELPVGGSNNNGGGDPFGSEFPDQSKSNDNAADKPLEERIVSKKWNERASAYEELSEILKKVTSSKDPVFYDHKEGFIKYLADNNPGALEKAVNCYIEYVKKAPDSVVRDIQEKSIDNLIAKSISHMKPTLQEKGKEAICCIIESTEDFEGVSEAVCKSIKSNNVKAASAGCSTIIHLINSFGLNRFPLKQLLGPVETAVGSRQASVRQEALRFYEECYKWVGDSIMPAVQKLNKPQQDELEKAFAKIKESGEPKPRPTRVTKKEEANKKQAEIDEICAKEEEEEKLAMDALDLEDEKDCLANFDDAWADDTLGQKKWNDKKQKLEQLNAQINTPKILPNRNVNAIVRVLEKMLKDSNMNVYDEAVKSVGYLANGLKREFHEQAKTLLPLVISNIKKRPNIIQDVVATLENSLKSVDLADIVPTIKEGLKDKSPVIVKQTAEFLQLAIKQTYIDDLKKIYAQICPD